MYELVVVWDQGPKSIYEYATEESAEDAARGMRMAFGHQITWCGVRKKVEK